MKIQEDLLITNFVDPYKNTNTEHGYMENIDWLKKEKKRIGHCKIIRDKEGLMALIRIRQTL
jgi:hypothetical protein